MSPQKEEEILQNLINQITRDWEEGREIYPVSEEEIIALKEAGAELIFWNKEGGHDTFCHEVEVGEKRFNASTLKPIL